MGSLLTTSPAWRALAEAQEPPHVGTLLAQDPERAERYSLALDDLLVDFSRHPLTDEIRERLLALARERGLAGRIEALFTGAVVNESEGRPALHTALRSSPEEVVRVEGEDVVPWVHAELERMAAFVEALRSGEIQGYDGQPIRHVVNIGIGGSEAGVTMAYEALAQGDEPLQLHTVSGVDGRELAAVWRRIDPAATLFCVASKSFTTLETLTNARTAWAWLAAAAGREVPEQFVGISADEEAMARFGLLEQRRFRIGPWVGGRYSLPSAMGLPLAAVVGMERFRALQAGMREMDRHFREAPLIANIPAMLGLLGVWQISLRGMTGHVALPYHPGLRRLPAYLQQLDMESLGKSVTQAGEPVDYPTGTSFWGEVGINAQHSFFQWLHQGTGRVLAEFLVPLEEQGVPEAHAGLTLASALGQAQALAQGQEPAADDPLAGHRRYTGNRPVTLILFRRLDARTLGRLIALHEHRVFVQASLWGINPFDQWGVELGKQLAKGLAPAARREGQLPEAADAATRQALAWAQQHG
ncbi:MAG: glucose-6-phosphate isomerase [Halorhodospira sp.]